MTRICEHDRRKEYCKECGGSQICEHNKIKSQCKDCGGSQICEHNKRKSRCTECGGGEICKHNRIKGCCKECGGSQICEHDKRKNRCKDCGGSQICEHDKIRECCKDCGGSKICEHNKIKTHCKECGGSQICEHSRHKNRCKDCGGSQLCKHDIRKEYCKECGGSSICEHGKRRTRCKKCDGRELCKSSFCDTSGNPKYQMYCLHCFIHIFPNEKISRNYKVKEKHVVDKVFEKFPNFTWFHDKRIQDGCSLRRPDLFLDYGTHVLMIEIDEQKHKSYDCSCINRRTMELSLDINHKPCIIIRFNPDEYINENGNKIKSPWRTSVKDGRLSIMKTQEKEWNDRINNLLNVIDYWIKNPTDKTVEIIEMYY